MSDTPPTGNHSRGLLGVGLFGLIVVGGLGIAAYLDAESTSAVAGTLTIDDVEFAPRHCRSGKLGETPPPNTPRFDGVDLFVSTSAGRVVRIVEDPTAGTSVLVMDPGEAPRPVDRSSCGRFEVDLEDTDALIMEFWGIEGSLDLDCPTVSGQLTFEGCYGGG